MARQCSCCESPHRIQLDRLLASGATVRSVAGKFQISHSCVDRHKRHHVQGLPTAKQRARGITAATALPVVAPQAPTVPDDFAIDPAAITRDVLARAHVRVLHRLDAVAQQIESAGPSKLAIDALRSVRESIESLSKLAGLLAPDNAQAPAHYSVTINLTGDPAHTAHSALPLTPRDVVLAAIGEAG